MCNETERPAWPVISMRLPDGMSDVHQGVFGFLLEELADDRRLEGLPFAAVASHREASDVPGSVVSGLYVYLGTRPPTGNEHPPALATVRLDDYAVIEIDLYLNTFDQHNFELCCDNSLNKASACLRDWLYGQLVRPWPAPIPTPPNRWPQ